MVAKVLWTLGVWAFCAVSCVLVATETMFGPTLFVIDSEHGVHLADIVAVVAFTLLALWLTWAFWRTPPEDRAPADRVAADGAVSGRGSP